LRQALAEFGWQELLAEQPALAIGALAELQGEYLTDTTLIDEMVPAGGARVLYPRPGYDTPTSTVAGATLSLHGLAVIGGAERLLVPALRDGGVVLVTIPTYAIAVAQDKQTGIDPDAGWYPVATEVALDTAHDVIGGDKASQRWASIRSAGQLALAHELLGVGKRMLALALEHVQSREQFGVQLGSFQAVKHKLADVALHREIAGLAAAAAWEDDLRPDSAELAKIAAGRFVRTAAAECQQVLGGMGFTWEHSFHRYLRRALLLEPILGSAAVLRATVGRQIRSTGVPRLAPL
jgi:alkylation response protein AidB-like acyl-CoA dehydrogenase